MFNLKDKVVVITGASSGLGNDAAKAYVAQGAKVAILARRTELLKELRAELEAQGGEVLDITCDITKEESVISAVDAIIERFGKIDVLLNNAGSAYRGDVIHQKPEKWDMVFNTNVKGMYLVCKYVIPHMIKQQYGKVVNISSINAFMGDKSDMFVRHSYVASKSSVYGLTIAMAASYGKHNITVNSIGPGLFESELTKDSLLKSPEFVDAYVNTNPMNRYGNRNELNGTIIYLSSDASSYVNGQFIAVDGGTLIV